MLEMSASQTRYLELLLSTLSLEIEFHFKTADPTQQFLWEVNSIAYPQDTPGFKASKL